MLKCKALRVQYMFLFFIFVHLLSQHFFLPRALPPPLLSESLVSWYATERHNYPLHLSHGANGWNWPLGGWGVGGRGQVPVIVNGVMSVEWPQCSAPLLQVTHSCPPPSPQHHTDNKWAPPSLLQGSAETEEILVSQTITPKWFGDCSFLPPSADGPLTSCFTSRLIWHLIFLPNFCLFPDRSK